MFTRDGYISHQALTGGIRYGRRSSDRNGCGWIAAFNVLRHLEDRPPEPEEVARGMRGGLIVFGLLGTWPFFVMKFLRRRGHDVRWSFRRVRQLGLVRNSDAALLLYVGPFLRPWKFRAHYVMLHRVTGDEVRVLNFTKGDCVMGIDSLLSRFERSTVTLVMGVRGRAQKNAAPAGAETAFEGMDG